MKRYVRTADGYIIDTQNAKPFMVVECYIDFNSYGRFKMISTSDSIEELVDCYIVYEKIDGFEGEHRIYEDLEAAEYFANDNSVIYGAIWTKGEYDYPIIKSVAKMNEKGEFELIEQEEDR